jgi:hypothetical protein
VLETELGPVVLEAPVSWTVLPGGERRPHPVRFRRLDPERFGFEAPPAPEGAALVVDPGVVWSTYLGDTDEDRVHALAPHPGGLVITGTTRSPLFPRVRGSYDIDKAAGYDAFVTWLRADIGWPVRSSFLGGAGDDLGEGLAVDAGGEVWVGGATGSPDLPVTAGAHDATHGGVWDGFLARFSAGGDQLLACTYLGASGDDLDVAGLEAVAEQPGEQVSRRRGQFRGLEDDRVAAGDGGDEGAEGELEGVVPWRRDEDGAVGLAP